MTASVVELGLDLTDVLTRDARAKVAGDPLFTRRQVIDLRQVKVEEVKLPEHLPQVLQDARLLLLGQPREVFRQSLHLQRLSVDRGTEHPLEEDKFLTELRRLALVEVECPPIVALGEVGGVESVGLGVIGGLGAKSRFDLHLGKASEAKRLHATAQGQEHALLLLGHHEDDGVLGRLLDELEELIPQHLLHALGEPDEEDAVASARAVEGHLLLKGLAFSGEDRSLLPIPPDEREPFVVAGVGPELEEASPVLQMVFAEILPRSVDDREEEREVRVAHFVEATTRRAMPAGIVFAPLLAVEVAGVGVG